MALSPPSGAKSAGTLFAYGTPGTHLTVSHPDESAHAESPGAKLRLENPAGQILERWESAGKPEEIIDKVKPGRPYRVVEEEPAPGDAPRPPVDFTVPESGSAGVVQPAAPEKEESGENPGSGEGAGTPVPAPAVPEQETIREIRIGFITAEYSRGLSGGGRIRIGRRIPGTDEWAYLSSRIGTGEEFPAELIAGVLLFSLSGFLFLLAALKKARRKLSRKERKRNE